MAPPLLRRLAVVVGAAVAAAQGATCPAWGQLPADAGQVWKTYDIAAFVRKCNDLGY